MVNSPGTASQALITITSGIDLELSFNQALEGLGISPQVAHLLWLPLPMALVLIAAVAVIVVSSAPVIIQILKDQGEGASDQTDDS